jgi:adenylosuccinate synthase
MMDRLVTVVTDLGFGDAGKGSIIDYLARNSGSPAAPVVVRFNGGAQAAHNVVTPDGCHHTFHQFGSAGFVPGARTHLSRFMLVNPLNLVREAEQLAAVGVPDALGRLTIDEAALIVTPYHQAANRLREIARGDGRHGSCGEGIGETMADWLEFSADALQAGDLARPAVAQRKLEAARERKLTQLAELLPGLKANPQAKADLETLYDTQLAWAVMKFYAAFVSQVQIVATDHLGRLLQSTPEVLFEGAQGVLLDEWRGFHPYTTWSTTTFANADQLLAEQGFDGEVRHLGLLRAYATRHGAGPFVTEDPALTAAIPDYHNGTNDWQREFRVGHFDLVAARYALEVAGRTDSLVITCLDRLPTGEQQRICVGYQTPAGRLDRLVPGPYQDLVYQEGLTRQLLQASPIYTSLTVRHPEDYLGYIEQEVGTSITLISQGVTATDKRERRP